MRQYEPFKRLFRLIGALLLMGAEVGRLRIYLERIFQQSDRKLHSGEEETG